MFGGGSSAKSGSRLMMILEQRTTIGVGQKDYGVTRPLFNGIHPYLDLLWCMMFDLLLTVPVSIFNLLYVVNHSQKEKKFI